MNNENLQSEYWDKVARKIAHIKITKPAEREIKRFFEFIGLEKKMKILDVGCGGGRLTLPLLRLGHQVSGTEVSEKSLDELALLAQQENLSQNLNLVKTNFEEPVFKEVFDLAILCNVIHHLDPAKKEKILANIFTSLRPQGKIAIIEPNPYHPLYYPWYFLKEITGQDKGRWKVEKNFLQSTPKKLKKLLLDIGFKDIEMQRYAVIPSRVGVVLKPILQINDLLVKIPLIKNMSAFLWFKAKK